MNMRMGSATARARHDRPETVKAPLFDQMIGQLEADRRWVVLELGGASTELLDVLSGFLTRVEIADMQGCGGLDMLNAATEVEEIEKLAELVLPRTASGEPIDVVLCWDLLNYLQPPAIDALARAIEARARPGTLAHGLVVYSDIDMPVTPRRFRPTADRHLREITDTTGTVKAPRYSPETLSRTMGNFSIERAMLLANGMQEFLFRL